MNAWRVVIVLAAVTLVSLLGAAPTAQAAITFVSDLGSNQADGGADSISIITTATAPAGASIIIVSVANGSEGNPTGVTCSDSAANVYSTNAINTAFDVAAICSTHRIATALAAGSTLTATWIGGGSPFTKRVRAFAVTGLASTPLDRTATASGTSTSPSSGAGGTTSQANELLVGLISDGTANVAGAGFSPGTNGTANNCASGTPTYTALAGVGTTTPPSLFGMYCIVASIGNYSAQATTSSTWQALLATFQAVLAPTITKTFGAASVPLNGSTSLSFTITNPNAATTLTVSFTDPLPGGLVVATPNGLTGSCGGGTITATPGAGSVSLTGATLPGGGTCTFSVNVTGTTAGVKNNSTTVNSVEAGPGNTTNASLTVLAPPTISKVFGAANLSTGGTTTLTFTLTNPNGGSTLTGVGFTDPLPAGLVVASPNGLTGSCGGGTITATAGSSTISLAGATLAAGASCTFTVSVTATAVGTFINTTSAVTSVEAGTGNTATATITVATTSIPTLSSYGQALAVLVLVLSGLLFLRRRLSVER